MKVFSVCLIFAGMVWALLALVVPLILGGIAEPLSLAALAGFLLVVFIGPVLLTIAPIPPLRGWHSKLGAIVTIVGCAIITAHVIYALTGLLHVRPLHLKPDYTFWAVIAGLALLCDAGALWLWRLVSSAQE